MVEMLHPSTVSNSRSAEILDQWMASRRKRELQNQKVIAILRQVEPLAVAAHLRIDSVQPSAVHHETIDSVMYMIEGSRTGRIEWKDAFATILFLATELNYVLSDGFGSAPLRLYGGWTGGRAASARAFPELLRSFIRQCGRPKVGSRYQAMMYALSPDQADRAKGEAWFVSHAASWRPLKWWLRRHSQLRCILKGDEIVDRHDRIVGRKVFDEHFEFRIRYRRIFARAPQPAPKTKGERAIRRLADLRKKRAWDLPYIYGRYATHH